MFLSNLPKSSIMDRSIPKNKFYTSCTTKQKDAFVEKINKIIWRNKLSIDTINVKGKDVEEILIIEIQLKEKVKINDILLLINKTIPYHIIFYVFCLDEYYISTSIKHSNTFNVNNSVVDYTICSEWEKDINKYKINLFNDLDSIYLDFCNQVLPISYPIKSFDKLIEVGELIYKFKRDIQTLEAQIKSCRQFNKKVELNSKFREIKQELKSLIDNKEYLSSNIS